jgi:hypothetical protein
MANLDGNSLQNAKKSIPTPPPSPQSAATGYPCEYVVMNNLAQRGRNSCVSSATRDLWERLFNDGYKADVCINTDNGGIVYAHSNIIVSSFIALDFVYARVLLVSYIKISLSNQ